MRLQRMVVGGAVFAMLGAGIVVSAASLGENAAAEPRTTAASPSGRPSRLTSPPAQGHTVTAAQFARQALDKLGPQNGHHALRVLDLDSGQSVTHGDTTHSFAAASIIKVDILAALLLRSQEKGTGLTERQKNLAESMIRHSDNVAADALWSDLGGRAGFDETRARLGVEPSTGKPAASWGLTGVTLADRTTLLKAVFTEDSPLSADSRAYIRSLMGSVITGQDWGISAAGDEDADRVLKNGWLPRTATGLWCINSTGLVSYGDRTLLVAVLSDDQPSQEAGIALVERLARTAVHSLADHL